MGKNKCKYNAAWAKDARFRESRGNSWIQKGKNDSYARCTLCSTEIEISNMGVAAEDERVTAAEGTWAYHTTKHSQSFLSTDCISSGGLFKAMFPDSGVAKKFSSARMKTSKIIGSVLAPHSIECVLANLGQQPFSISIDASNHREIKLVPLVIRFFTRETGVQVRVLALEALPGETSDQLINFIKSTLRKHNLDIANLVAFCADNAPVNFGRGNNNVFIKLKQERPNLVPIGCPAHVLHNAARKAADGLSIDFEAIAFKLASYFKSSTTRHERLKELCVELETEYSTLPSHGATRWLTLFSVISRMLELWQPLEALFTSPEDKPPRLLYDFFSSTESKVMCHFLESALKIFQEPLILLQKSELLLPQLYEIMASFNAKISYRKQQHFYGATTAGLLRQLEDGERQTLEASFEEFYTTVLDYVENWFRLERLPGSIGWVMLLENSVSYDVVRSTAEQFFPDIALNDELFDEVSQLNDILRGTGGVGQALDPATVWKKIFSHNELPHLYRLVSAILSIPVSNAFVERIFSMSEGSGQRAGILSL